MRYEPAFVATQAELLLGRKILDRTLQSFTPQHVSNAADPTQSVRDGLVVAPIDGAYAMQVSYRAPDPGEAVRLLEALIESYIEHLRLSEHNTHFQLITTLTDSEKETRRQLEEKQSQYLAFRRSSGLVGVGRDAGRIQSEYLTNLGRALTEASSRRIRLEHQLGPLAGTDQVKMQESESSATSLVSSRKVDQPTAFRNVLLLQKIAQTASAAKILDLEKELEDAVAWEQELDASFGDSHPALRAVRSRVVDLRFGLKEMLNSIPLAIKDELSAALKNEEELGKLYESELEKAKKLDAVQLEAEHFSDAIARLKAVHDSQLKEIQSEQFASLSAANGRGVVHVETVTPPKSKKNAVWPIAPLVLAISGAMGFLVGSGMAVGFEQLTRRPSQTGEPR